MKTDDPNNGTFDELLAQRLQLKRDVLNNAIRGDSIAGGYASLVASSHLAHYIDDLNDYDDDDEDIDIRPY